MAQRKGFWLTVGGPMFLLVLILLSPTLHAQAQALANSREIMEQPSMIPKSTTDEFPFPLGEKLTFDISNFLASVGKLELTFRGKTQYRGQEMLWITSESAGLGMTDREDIFACPESWLPLFVLRDVSKAGIQSKLTESYDQELCKVVVTAEGQKEPVEVIDKEEKLNNVILLYYLFRMKPLESGEKFDIVTPREDYNVEVGELENIKVPYGDYKVRPLTSDPKKFTVWISDEKEPLLVKMKLKTKLGSFTFELTRKETVDVKVASNSPATDSTRPR